MPPLFLLLAAGILLALRQGFSPSSPVPRLSKGKKILLIGDSQTESKYSPGGRLAGLLRDAGYAVTVFAKGGQTAWYFLHEGKRRFLAELAAKPEWVIVFLGTNELANVAAGGNLQTQAKAHIALRNAIVASGAKVLFVGPPDFDADVYGSTGKMPIVKAMLLLVPELQRVYPGREFLDARPLTPMPHGEIHFPKTAKEFAEKLAPAILARIR